jgi:hypothetical protein
MTYPTAGTLALCRVTPNNFSPSDLNCIMFEGRDVVAFLDGQSGTVMIEPPNRWEASGAAHDFSRTPKTFSLSSGAVTSTTLTLSFAIDGVAYTFTGTPAQNPTSGSAIGVYSSAYMRGEISFTVSANWEIFGQGAGCVINGSTDSLGLFGYFVEFSPTNCGVPAGVYAGFGIITQSIPVPTPGGETTMLAFAVTSPTGRWLAGHALK